MAEDEKTSTEVLSETVKALSEEEELRRKVERLKLNGKLAFQDGGDEGFAEAVYCWKKALELCDSKPMMIKDKRLRCLLWNNLATVHHRIQDFKQALLCAQNAIKCDRGFCKAYFRCASVLSELGKTSSSSDFSKSQNYFSEAIDHCDTAISLLESQDSTLKCDDSTSSSSSSAVCSQLKSFRKLRSQIEMRKDKESQKETDRRAGSEVTKQKETLLRRVCDLKSYTFGEDSFSTVGSYPDLIPVSFARGEYEIWQIHQNQSQQQSSESKKQINEDESVLRNLCVSLPVIFVYPQYSVSDLIKDFADSDSFISHIRMMFPPECTDPPSWDTNQEYLSHSLSLFYRNQQGKMIEFNTECTLEEVLGRSDLVIPRVPVFFAVPKHSEFMSDFHSEWSKS